MIDEQTVAGVIDEMLDQAGDFWLILEADSTLEPDDRADLTRMIEEAEAVIKDAKNLLHKISERE